MATETAAKSFLDPAFVSRLSRLDVVARLVVEGFLTGLHRSPYHGFSVEFAEHRPYNAGDPVRFVDWRLFAKTDRYHVKQYEEETNLRAHVLLDTSASMGYRSKGPITKLRYATLLAGALTYMMQGQRDAVGLLTFDDAVRTMLPAKATQIHARRVLAELENAEPGKGTKIAPAIRAVAERIRRRGLILLLSDLMDRPEEVVQGLKHFRHGHHEVVVFHVLDPAEREFPFQGDTEFEDMETGAKIATNAWEVRDAYLEKLREWTTFYGRACGEIGVEYVPTTTSTSFDLALFRYLEKRSRLI